MMLACQTPTSYTTSSSNLYTRYPHAGTGGFSADAPVTCHAGDEVHFRSDAAAAALTPQQVPAGDDTGTDLESTLEGIAASATLLESLGGSAAIMHDLYDIFANPSAFPFPPEVIGGGGDHAATATSSSAATPMDVDVQATVYGGFVPASASCQPEVFKSTSSGTTCSAVSEHQLTMTGASGEQSFEMKADVELTAGRHLSQCHGHSAQQDMDVVDFHIATAGRADQQLTSQRLRQESSLSQAAPLRAHHPHLAAVHLRRHHQQPQLLPSPTPAAVYSPRCAGQFYAAAAGFVDLSPPPAAPSSPPAHFRFPSAAATLGYHRAFQQQQQQQQQQRRRPELALMMTRPSYAALDTTQMSPPMSAAQMTSDISDQSAASGGTAQSPATPSTPGSSRSSSSSDMTAAGGFFAVPSPPHSAPAAASVGGGCALPSAGVKTAVTETKSTGAATGRDGLCAVCGDSAICQHYGVRTCEGCKGFFKRTVQKSAKYVCLANHNCVIDKRHRNRCQFCRFQKCLAVGMVREVVRTDSLKGRRGRLPSKPRSPSESPPSPPVSFITALVRAHVDTSPATPDLDYSQYCVPSEEEDLPTAGMIQQFYDCLIQSIDAVKAWANRVPGFSELCKHDQDQLFQSAALELVMLRIAYNCRLESGDDRVIFSNGLVLHQQQCLSTFGPAWLEAIADFGASLRKHAIDISTLACMAALALITHRHGLMEAKRVDDLQNRVLDALRDHCTYNAATQHLLFARAIGLLPQLRTVSRLGVDRLRALKHQQGGAGGEAITPSSPELIAAATTPLACSAAPLQSPF